jgi:hypothetical protein
MLVLTAVDMWVALDTLVCQKYPVMKKYSPEVPENFLIHVLLR